MVRIAFDLRRPALVAAHQDRRAYAAHRRGRRKKQRFAGNVVFRLGDVRNDLLRWLKNTTSQTGKRERRAHQLDKTPALDGIVPYVTQPEDHVPDRKSTRLNSS